MGDRLTPDAAAALLAELDATADAEDATPRVRAIRDPTDTYDTTPPSELVKHACTADTLRDYIAEQKPHGRLAHVGNVRCPSTTHNDSTPSCSVGLDGATAVWHCHGCGAGGTLIDAIIAAEGCDERTALQRAATITNISLPQRPTAHHSDTPPTQRTTTPPTTSDAAEAPLAALDVWNSTPGAWALESERTTGRPAPAILRAALTETAARLHGWTLENRPVSIYTGLVGGPSAGKSGSANVARGCIQWPTNERWQTTWDGGLITDFTPESAEGLLDELARGREPDGDETERRPWPAAIIRIDEGEYLHPPRSKDQAEATKRDLRSLWSGDRIRRRRKQSPDTPPRIVAHKPTIALIINLTAGPAATLLAATNGDRERTRLALAVRITTNQAPGGKPPTYQPPPLAEPNPADSDITIHADVAADVKKRRHAHQMAIRNDTPTGDSEHTIDAELRDAACLATLATGHPHIRPEDWAAAQDLTTIHEYAEQWVHTHETRAAAARNAARGRGDAHAAWAQAEHGEALDQRLANEAADLIETAAADTPITRTDTQRCLANLRRRWKRHTGEGPASLAAAAAHILITERGWQQRDGERPARGPTPQTLIPPNYTKGQT